MPRWTLSYGVAPQNFAGPQPSKHLYLAPSEVQSGSVLQGLEHTVPAEWHAPPSRSMTARSRQAPEAHSVPVAHRSLGPLLTAALQAATVKTATRIEQKIFMRRMSAQTAPCGWKSVMRDDVTRAFAELSMRPQALENKPETRGHRSHHDEDDREA